MDSCSQRSINYPFHPFSSSYSAGGLHRVAIGHRMYDVTGGLLGDADSTRNLK